MTKEDNGGGGQGQGGDGNPGQGGGNEGQGKELTIYVNTRAKKWNKEKISYADLVALAVTDAPPPSTGGNIEYTITYRNGDKHKPEGNLAQGESVKVADGEIFDVYPTDKS